MQRRRRVLPTQKIVLVIRVTCLLTFLVLVRYGSNPESHAKQCDLKKTYEQYIDRQADEIPLDLDVRYDRLRYSYFIYLFGSP